MEEVLNVIKDKTLTYQQKVIGLARIAENSINVLSIREDIEEYRQEGIICDLYEGNAPYRPRYIVPNYEKFMAKGSEFLGLKPPTDIWEAINNLLILYKHVPSITSFPVYIGNIDTLLEPFVTDEKEARKAISFFLTHIDRTLTDSFCHANIGPLETTAGKIILEVEKELQNAVPNITLKYSDETADAFAIQAIDTALVTAKPSFANHEIYTKDLGNYAVVSCYNGLPIGGGSHTLVRLNLAKLAEKTTEIETFLKVILPDAIEKMVTYMDERIRFLVEESEFFQTNFLVKEGLINLENFTSMFGIFGLAEGVNHLIQPQNQKEKFGHGDVANDLGMKIIKNIYEIVNQHKANYCNASGGKYLLHAQVGTDFDHGISPGCRIPIGDEPEIHEHLLQSAKFHQFFPAGIGDVFKFDKTTKNNPKYILDIIKGAFTIGMRYFSLYCTHSDVVRITGYLVKRSDMEKLESGEQVLHDTVVLGLGSVKNQKVLDRRLRKDE